MECRRCLFFVYDKTFVFGYLFNHTAKEPNIEPRIPHMKENIASSCFFTNKIFIRRSRIRSTASSIFDEVPESRSCSRSSPKFKRATFELLARCSLSRLNKQVIPSDLAGPLSPVSFSHASRRYSCGQTCRRGAKRDETRATMGAVAIAATITRRLDRVNALSSRYTRENRPAGTLI